MRHTLLAVLGVVALGCASTPPVPAHPAQSAEPSEAPPQGSTEELDPAVFAQVLQRHSGDVQACYERTLASSPELQGRLLLRLTLAPDGSVREARVAESTLGSPEVHQCIESASARWRFPALPAGETEVDVEYPLVLQPSPPAP